MPVPAKRRAKSQAKRRRSHHALKVKELKKCPTCGRAVESHRACGFCGSYNKKEVLKIKVKTKKKTESAEK